MYSNLRAEMARRNLSSTAVAEKIGVAPSTFSLKMTGRTKWFFWECCSIKQILKTSMPLEQLFDEK